MAKQNISAKKVGCLYFLYKRKNIIPGISTTGINIHFNIIIHHIMENIADILAATTCTLPSNSMSLNLGDKATKRIGAVVKKAKNLNGSGVFSNKTGTRRAAVENNAI